MDMMVISLQWIIARRMAIHAAGAGKDFCYFGKHRLRASGAIRNLRKRCRRPQLTRRLRWGAEDEQRTQQH
jgi:hypothetical protein